jgi:hypothetical protein
MQGIRIQALYAHDDAGRVPSRGRDYGLVDLAALLAPFITRLYWVLDDVIPNHVAADGSTFDDYQNRNNELIIWTEGHLRLAARDFIPHYAKFIHGDWDRIVGVRTPYPPHVVTAWETSTVPQEAVVLFACIDACYWEVYSPDAALLERLERKCAAWVRVVRATAPISARPN